MYLIRPGHTKRVGTLGDGWHATPKTPAQLRDALGRLRAAADAAHRPFDSLALSLRFALRDELLARGHVVRSRSDVEVIVHVYEELGDGFVARLQGMFAVALWDERRKRLLIARDRLGIKPLCYAVVDGVLYFASEAKALLPSLPEVRTNLDALRDYF